MEITDKKKMAKRPVTPTAECLECKLFLTFMKCFGLTFAEIKR